MKQISERLIPFIKPYEPKDGISGDVQKVLENRHNMSHNNTEELEARAREEEKTRLRVAAK